MTIEELKKRSPKDLVVVKIGERKSQRHVDHEPAGLGVERVVSRRISRKNITQEGYELLGTVEEVLAQRTKSGAAPAPKAKPKPDPIPSPKKEETNNGHHQDPEDDLESRDREDIKALADSLGIEYGKSANTKSIIKKIRENNQ